METETHFDLTSATENWRQELALTHLSAEDQRELKAHLNDAVAELQKRGLTAEESFWLARRRVGHPQQLGAEFVKANPAAIWRERVLWMAAALLIMGLWNSTFSHIYWSIANSRFDFAKVSFASEWLRQFSAFSFRNLPLVIFVVFLLRGTERIFLLLKPLFQSRSRFVSTALIWIILNAGLTIFPYLATFHRHPDGRDPVFRWNLINQSAAMFSGVVWELGLVYMIVWLMPSRDQSAPKVA